MKTNKKLLTVTAIIMLFALVFVLAKSNVLESNLGQAFASDWPTIEMVSDWPTIEMVSDWPTIEMVSDWPTIEMVSDWPTIEMVSDWPTIEMV